MAVPPATDWHWRVLRAVDLRGTDNIKQHQVVNGYRGPQISKTATLATELPLMILATSTVALRLWSRLAVKRMLAVDDVLITLGWACAFGRTVISCMSADDPWGFSIDGPDEPAEIPYYQHIFERRIAYIFAVAFIRTSVVSYYLRIFPPSLRSLRRLSWVLLVLALAQFIEVFTVLIVFCKDISKIWTSDYIAFRGSRCFSSSTYSYSAAIGDSVLDCLIFALPIPYVWSLTKLRFRQRFSLVIIFALGFLVCAVALTQIPFIQRREQNSNYFGGAINLLIAIQLALAIIAASLPDLRALIARFFPKFEHLHRSSSSGRDAQQDAHDHYGDVENSGDDLRYPQRAQDCQKRQSKIPDWMRPALPASLMESRNPSDTELANTRHSCEDDRPGRAKTGEFKIGFESSSSLSAGVGLGVGMRSGQPRRGSAFSRRATVADITPLPQHSEKSEVSSH